MKAKPAELALSVAIVGLGIAVAVGASRMSAASGYARVGPNVAPTIIAGGLILLGLWLVYEALSGGWRNAASDDPAERGEHAFHFPAFLWVSAGLLAQMLLIHRAGFIIALAVLFGCVARAFGSARLARDLAIGLVLALGIFLFFVKFLNVNLPAGWLQPLFGGAGI